MNKKLFFLLLIVFTAGLTFFLWPNDEKKIRHNLSVLAGYCSSAPQEAAMDGLAKAARAAKLCSDPCHVQVESFQLTAEFPKKELRDHIIMMKKRLPGTTFTFHDTVVEFAGNDLAEIVTTLTLSGKIADSRFTDAYELRLRTERIDGDWLFSSFSVVEFMEK